MNLLIEIYNITMAGRNLTLDEIVQPYIKPILRHIEDATAKGFWQGIDGARQYIDGDRLNMLKHHDEKDQKAYKYALKVCFLAIVGVSLSKGTMDVLKGFVSTYPDLIMSFAKNNPEIFDNPEIRSPCRKALGASQQRVFDSTLASKNKPPKAR